MSTRRALELAALVAVFVWGMAAPPAAPTVTGRGRPGRNDVALFQAIIARVAHGEAYYPVMAHELTTRGYPTGSVANWRTPFYLTLAARAPRLLRGLLWMLGGLLLLGTYQLVRPKGRGVVLATLWLQVGALAGAWSPLGACLAEPFAGLLIALSVLVTLLGWRGTSIGLGTAALFVRELAAPYVGLRFLLAAYRREWRQAAGWGLGVAVYAAFFLWHSSQVHAAMPTYNPVHSRSWIAFGGVRVVLETLRTNAWLAVAPWWIAPGALVLALVGAWQAPLVIRLPVLGYLGLFAVVGLPFNGYWGWVPGMLLPLAWASAAAAVSAPPTCPVPVCTS